MSREIRDHSVCIGGERSKETLPPKEVALLGGVTLLK